MVLEHLDYGSWFRIMDKQGRKGGEVSLEGQGHSFLHSQYMFLFISKMKNIWSDDEEVYFAQEPAQLYNVVGSVT